MKVNGNREIFAKELEERAIVVLRSYPMIIKSVLVKFDCSNKEDLKEIARKSGGKPEMVMEARWAKLPEMRSKPKIRIFSSLHEISRGSERYTTGRHIYTRQMMCCKEIQDRPAQMQ